MRIQGLEAVSVAYPEPNDADATRHLTFCRIQTEDGHTGWGEAVTMWPEACRATEAVIAGMAPLVVGRDPVEVDAIHRDLREHAWWYGPQGIASFAISAIDIALWDLKGKVLDRPLVELLGGVVQERIPVIASTHAFGPSLEGEAERHGAYVADGYRGVKIGLGKRGGTHLGYDIDRDVRFMRLLREAVGPEADIMLDRGAGLRWDLSSTIRRTQRLEEHGLRWIEEPCDPQAVDDFRTLRQHVTTLLAGGEREWDPAGYRGVIDWGLLDVIGCDPGRVGGITGARHVLRTVEDAGVWFNAHAWSSAVVSAASLAITASTDRSLVFELKPIENPMQHELVAEPIGHDGGWASPLPGPGLGVQVDETIIDRYRF